LPEGGRRGRLRLSAAPGAFSSCGVVKNWARADDPTAAGRTGCVPGDLGGRRWPRSRPRYVWWRGGLGGCSRDPGRPRGESGAGPLRQASASGDGFTPGTGRIGPPPRVAPRRRAGRDLRKGGGDVKCWTSPFRPPPRDDARSGHRPARPGHGTTVIGNGRRGNDRDAAGPRGALHWIRETRRFALPPSPIPALWAGGSRPSPRRHDARGLAYDRSLGEPCALKLRFRPPFRAAARRPVGPGRWPGDAAPVSSKLERCLRPAPK